VVTLLANADFQADSPPLITDEGKSMFWGVSRNAVVAWTESTFDRDPGGNKVSFTPRGDPTSRPVIAKIATSRSGVLSERILYTGSAANHFAAINIATGNDGLPQIFDKWTVTTGSPVWTEAQVSPDDTVVYTIEQIGTMHAINTADGTINWSSSIQGNVFASGFAQSMEGDVLYFADSDGFVRAWKVATIGPPVAPTTNAPITKMPVTVAPVAPSPPVQAPDTMAPVEDPIPDPTAAPVMPTGGAPVPASPTTAPVPASPTTDAPTPTDAPAPTDAPTSSAATSGIVGIVAAVVVGLFL